ncbi:MAG: DUF799 family lipoprotein [Elusimicrobia bacterium]|nr:DUF799 family lipoprotein [Elusimicrobiota bacterium]
MALFPFANESLDLDAPRLAREATAARLREKGYRVLDADRVDAALKDLGFTDGGQLGALPLPTLAAELGADLYGFGTVSEYVVQSAVALTRRAVALTLRLTDPEGRIFFRSSGAVQESSAGTEAAGALVEHLARKAVRAGELKAETDEAAKRLLEKLPAAR